MSDETTPDLTALLAEHAPTYTEHANDPTTTFYCKTCSDAAGDWVTWTPAHLAEQITAAGFGPVRAVEAEVARLREERSSRTVAMDLIHEASEATARAESAEAALLAARCDADDLRSRLALAEDLIEDMTGMRGGAPLTPVRSVPVPLPTGPAHEDDE